MTVRGQGLEVAAKSSAEFRLHRLEVSNWGPFEGVSILELDAATGVVTGDPGTGQSALAEAIVELLAPAERDITGIAEGRSVVLGVFRTSGGTQTVSLAQVFQRTAPQVELARLYVCAEQDLSVAAHFDAPAGGLGALGESLRRLGAQVEPAPRKYAAWFRRRFGIRDAYALHSLRAMASMRAAGDVDGTVRRHVLDGFDPAPRLGELLAAFGELERANHALQNLRQGEAMLSSILTRCEAHDRQSRAVADVRACREGLPAHFARHRLALLDRRLACMRSIREQLSAQITRLESRLEERRGQGDALRTAVATNGGERLERLSAEIRRLVGARDARRAKAERYADLLRRIGEAAPADEAAFHVQRDKLKLMRDE
ncbi:MAG: ATP-dependent exonuclease SbcCD, C subunit-like protein, partial [Betaproteobacteria bacterium]